MVQRIAIVATVSLTLFANPLSESLKKDLQAFSHIADISKENEFFQPHIVSIYRGYELEKLGVQTLQDALWLVPGVDIYADNMGITYPVFRGSNPITFGQTKLFIDGVLVNNLFGDHYTQYMQMPIELIKRIEVVRGPGSKSEGVNAYAGSIYITTYAENFGEFECNKVFVKRGSQLFRGGGFYTNHHLGELKLYTEFYYQQDDKSVYSGPDMLYTGYLGEVNKPLAKAGEAPLWLKNYSFAMTMSLGGFKLQIRDNRYKHGMGFGVSYLLPPKNDYYLMPNRYMEMSYQKDLAKVWHLELKSGVRHDSLSMDTHYAPAGLVVPSPFDPDRIVVYKEGMYGFFQAKQSTIYAKAYLGYKGWSRHEVVFGVRSSKERTYGVTTITTDKTGQSGQLVDYSESFPFLDPKAKRVSSIFFLSDTFEYSRDLTFYYGINLERNTQSDYIFNPRFSMVYQIDTANIFKASYAKSQRNPSWQELFTINNITKVGNPHLRPERVHALEASFIHRFGADDFVQASIFFLRNKNLIDNINLEHKYLNRKDQNLYGFELELSKMVDAYTKLYANYSFVDGRNSCGTPLANIAKHMAKGYLLRQLTPNLSVSLLARYVGDKHRFSFDTRKPLRGYTTCDLGLSYAFDNGLHLRFSAKNIFDATIKYPSPPYTYIEDYSAMKGRAFIFSMVWGL